MPISQQSIRDHEASHAKALAKLWRNWKGGALAQHAALLAAMVRQRQGEIRALAGWNSDPEALILAIKRLVVEEETVHHPTEMRDQLREIHNDIWYHGQRGDYDRRRIIRDWTGKHGAKWRHWRIAEYLFVIDRIADELLKTAQRTERHEQLNRRPFPCPPP